MLPDFATTAQQTYPTQMAHFNELLKNGQLSHLYLFVGSSQSTRLAFSRYLAWQVVGATDRNALRINENEHPDVHLVAPKEEGATLKVAQVRDLTPEFVTTTLESPKKVFILDAVETMTASAANSLLKFIEEPAGPQLILLLTNNLQDVLPTIQSRAQIVHLNPEISLVDTNDIDDSWQKNTQMLLFKWFELMMQRKIEAFAYVQTTLISQITTDLQQKMFMKWLRELARDMVVYSATADENLRFPSLIGFYKTLAKHYHVRQLVHAAEAIFADDKLRKINISLQARLEKMALEVTIALGE